MASKFPIVNDAIKCLKAYNSAKTGNARIVNKTKYLAALRIMTKPAADDLFSIVATQYPTLKQPR
jgi:hypothetical protein